MELTETIVIRLDLYAEFLTLMACARILAEAPISTVARDWTFRSLTALANPKLYNAPDADASV